MATTPNNITALPIPPSSADTATFDVRADAFLAALPDMVTQLNSANSATYNNAVEASTAAGTASAAAATAAASASNLSTLEKLYLGGKTLDPTLDNQGATLIAGASYYNTVSLKIRAYSGSIWVDGITDGFDPASPGTIGSTTPNSGAFTTLTTSSTATVGNTSNVVSGAVNVVGTSDATTRTHIIKYSADAIGTGYFVNKSRGATIGTNTILQNNDEIGFLSFRASDGAIFQTAALIQAFVDGTPGTNDMPGRLVFSTTADGASVPTERMRIDSAGNVGIGTSPAIHTSVLVQKTLTGAVNAHNIYSAPSNAADVTSGMSSFVSVPTATNTINSVYGFWATQGTFTGAVTNQMGFYVASNLTGATNNYGFYSNIASGANRWNFYAAGTADNYFAGNVLYNDAVTSRAMFKDCGAVYLDKGNSGTSAQTLDYTAGSHQRLTVTGAFTLSTSNWPPTGNLGQLMLELVNGASSAITWPTINWVKSDGTTTTTFASNGVTLQTSGIDWVILWSRDAGTTIYGKIIR